MIRALLQRRSARAFWTAALCALVAVTMPIRAHHSLAEQDSGSRITIEGVIARFQFINPHPFVNVTVVNDKGKKEEWRLELDNRFELEAIGMTSRTLVPGDRIVVSGMRGRSQLTNLYVRRLDRPADGFWYEQVGSTPKIR